MFYIYLTFDFLIEILLSHKHSIKKFFYKEERYFTSFATLLKTTRKLSGTHFYHYV